MVKTAHKVCLPLREWVDWDAQICLCPLFILHKAAVTASGVGGGLQDSREERSLKHLPRPTHHINLCKDQKNKVGFNLILGCWNVQTTFKPHNSLQTSYHKSSHHSFFTPMIYVNPYEDRASIWTFVFKLTKSIVEQPLLLPPALSFQLLTRQMSLLNRCHNSWATLPNPAGQSCYIMNATSKANTVKVTVAHICVILQYFFSGSFALHIFFIIVIISIVLIPFC